MPFVDAQVLAQLLDVLDEVPRRVLLEHGGPGQRLGTQDGRVQHAGEYSRGGLAGPTLVEEHDLRRGVSPMK